MMLIGDWCPVAGNGEEDVVVRGSDALRHTLPQNGPGVTSRACTRNRDADTDAASASATTTHDSPSHTMAFFQPQGTKAAQKQSAVDPQHQPWVEK